MTSSTPYHCPVIPVGELHGQTPKARLATRLTLGETARPGDIVALRQPGCMLDNSLSIGAALPVTTSAAGFHEERLGDLPAHLRPGLAQCGAAIDDDWEILEEFPSEFLAPGETGLARLELIYCLGALMFIWLEKARAFGTPPTLLVSTHQPATLFVQEADLLRPGARHRRRLQAQIDLCEWLSEVPILRPTLT
ncbi:hypothetical protein T8T21_16150 (plasmid) [Limimaricola variabilis]|uniref:hypothetical protein n=1 Tax=Limimaricola variabilis TaxID=1492771 RepID=UPI002AC8BCFA|nr:hypothetical protein [Limimaricola variabilis]WPY96305.1 hypothetical protein T8T21_16150 [Limimaricola variabilis]